MRGRIYTDQKCPICGDNFTHDEHRRRLYCQNHPDQMPTGRFQVQFGRNTRRRFAVYREAERFLDGLRWEVDQGTYDPRDYRVDYPQIWLGIKWLPTYISIRPNELINIKEKELVLSSDISSSQVQKKKRLKFPRG